MDQTLAAAIIAGAAALIGKIVWDWLSELRKSRRDEIKHEGDCARLVALEQQFHAAHLALTQNVATMQGDIGVMKNDLGYIKRKLDLNGSAK